MITIPVPIHPPSTAGAPLGLGITLAQLYELSDRLAAQYSDEQIIASAEATWTAPVYGHYILGLQRAYVRDPVTGAMVLDHILFTFTCRFDPIRCKMRTRKRKATGTHGTSNLKNAVRKCDKRRQVPDSLAPANQSQYSHIRLRALILMWCAAGQKPFDAIQNPTFLRLVHFLRPDAKVPSITTMSSDLAHIYTQVTPSIREKFEGIDTGVHLVVDGWLSPLTTSFIGIIVVWREGVKIWRTVLDFIYLTGSHTSEYTAEKIVDCLTRFGTINRIRTICLNQSDDDTVIRELARSLPNFNGPKSRINCGTHAIDMIAQSFTSVLTRLAAKKRRIATNSKIDPPREEPLAGDLRASSTTAETLGDSNDPEITLDELDGVLRFPIEADEGKELYDNDRAQKAVLASMTHMKLHYGVTTSDEYTREVQDLLPKICGFFNRLSESEYDSTAFAEIRESVGDYIPLDVEVPVDVDPTRWEDVLRCSESFQALRVPIETLVSDEIHNLSQYKLTDYQWSLNEELAACIQVFREPALFLSQKEVPIIHEVLPTFTLLKFRLERIRDDDQILDKHPALRIAAQSSIITLDEHMRTMAQSEVYSMATVLCPYYKLAWFVEQGYEPTCIEELSRTLYDHFARANPPTTAPAHPTPTTAQSTSPWMRKPTPARRPPVPSTPGQGWVTAYLSSPVVSKESIDRMGGILNYWTYEQQRGSPLARVALDLLSSPTSTVDTRRPFSGAQTAANYRQHQMSLSTFSANMAVGSWYKTPLLPEIDVVVDILNDWEGSDHGSLEL